jgi:hypothetical protein
VIDVVAVPTQTSRTPVEDGGVGEIGVLAPVPVGLGTREAALCFEGCLVGPVLEARVSIQMTTCGRDMDGLMKRGATQHTIYNTDASA